MFGCIYIFKRYEDFDSFYFNIGGDGNILFILYFFKLLNWWFIVI